MVLIRTPHADFLPFCKRQLAISDFDAEHPICIWLVKNQKMGLEQSLWLCFLYMAFYDEASMWVTYNKCRPFTIPTDVKLPIGLNRRNLFGGKIKQHFESLREQQKTAKNWPVHNFTGDPKQDWDLLRENLETVWGNGRFAIYTTAEMIQKVCSINVEITGFDNKGSSGPADGLSRVYGCSKKDVPELDLCGEAAFRLIKKTGWESTYHSPIDRGVAESLLCTFSGTCRGKFYSGRNLDRQQQRIINVESMGHNLPILWKARQETLVRKTLGEFNGWEGIDKKRLKHYQKTGEILWTYEKR